MTNYRCPIQRYKVWMTPITLFQLWSIFNLVWPHPTLLDCWTHQVHLTHPNINFLLCFMFILYKTRVLQTQVCQWSKSTMPCSSLYSADWDGHWVTDNVWIRHGEESSATTPPSSSSNLTTSTTTTTVIVIPVHYMNKVWPGCSRS